MNNQKEQPKEVTITVTLKTTPGFTRLRMSETYGNVTTDAGERIGGAGACVGAAIQVDVDGDEYVLPAVDLFNAVVTAIGKVEYVI